VKKVQKQKQPVLNKKQMVEMIEIKGQKVAHRLNVVLQVLVQAEESQLAAELPDQGSR
jgi:hypothetical protein